MPTTSGWLSCSPERRREFNWGRSKSWRTWLESENRSRIEHRRSLQFALDEHCMGGSTLRTNRLNHAHYLGPGTRLKLKKGYRRDDAANRAFHTLVLLVHQHLDRTRFHCIPEKTMPPTIRLRFCVETLVKLHDHSSAEQGGKLSRLSITKSTQKNSVRIIPASNCE